MPTLRHSALAGLLSCLAFAACTRPDAEPATDTPVADTVAQSDTSAAGVDLRGWTEDAGPALLVADEAGERMAVVLPRFSDSMLADSTLPQDLPIELAAVAGSAVDLFGRSGRAGTATVSAADELSIPEAGACTAWPSLSMSGTPPGRTWTVGLTSGRATAIPLDSADVLAGADSARLTAEVSRIASSLPNDTVPAFRGLPFAVRSVRRFNPAPGVSALVAEVVRRVNQEANPREERILLVAERDSGRTTGRYERAYSERASGTEEDVETTDVLAALALGPARTPTLVLRREYFEGSAYALLERTGPRNWRVRWTSAYAGC